MDTIHATIMTGVEAIARFTQRSEEIHTILDVIHDITSQTSLLALNANYRGTGGTHGRGFAIVAEEIKNLANGVEALPKILQALSAHCSKRLNRLSLRFIPAQPMFVTALHKLQEARVTLEQILVSARRNFLAGNGYYRKRYPG